MRYNINYLNLDKRYKRFEVSLLNDEIFNLYFKTKNYILKNMYEPSYIIDVIKLPKSEAKKLSDHFDGLNDYVFLHRHNKPDILLCHGKFDGKVYLEGKQYTLEELSKAFPEYKKLNIVCCWGAYIEPYITNDVEFNVLTKVKEPLFTNYITDDNGNVYLYYETLSKVIITNLIKNKDWFNNIDEMEIFRLYYYDYDFAKE